MYKRTLKKKKKKTEAFALENGPLGSLLCLSSMSSGHIQVTSIWTYAISAGRDVPGTLVGRTDPFPCYVLGDMSTLLV